jgi:UDP-3-O-[3-hydroxymyristoyl] glucosamine N-acyltransferase
MRRRRFSCRIRALRDFADIKAGDIGGFVESEANLDHSGDAWIGNSARVYEEARVSGNARIRGFTKIYNWAHIFGNAQVDDYVNVSGRVRISGNAQLYGRASVYDDVQIDGCAKIHGNASIRNRVRISDNAEVSGEANVHNNVQICGNARIRDWACITEDAKVSGGTIGDNAHVAKSALIQSQDDILVISKSMGKYYCATVYRTKDMGIRAEWGSSGGYNVSLEGFLEMLKEEHEGSKLATARELAAKLAQIVSV